MKEFTTKKLTGEGAVRQCRVVRGTTTSGKPSVGHAFESFPYVSLWCASLDVLSASGYPCVVVLSVSCCQTSPISVTCVVRSEYRTSLVSVILSVTRKGEDFCPSAERWVMSVSFPVCRNSALTWPDFSFGYSLEVHEPEDSWTAIAAQLLFRVMYAVAREVQLYLVTVLL